MKLEEMNLSEKCLEDLKNYGNDEAEDFVDFLENVAGKAMVSLNISSECFDEMVDKLVELGFLDKDRWGKAD